MNWIQRFLLWLARVDPASTQGKSTDRADTIKELAVITAVPRWVGALMLAEGFDIPVGWLVWWKPLSALLAVAMAGVEGWAFSYVFGAWRKQGGGKLLFSFAILAGVIFIIVLTPFIVMQAAATGLSATLSGNGLWLWGAAVASSTIVIVASVGYAQMDRGGTVVIDVYNQVVADLTDAQDGYNRAQRELSDYQSLATWRQALTRFPDDKQGIVARVIFSANGNEPQVNDIIEALGVSRGTVKLGQSLANAMTMILTNESNAAIIEATGLELKKVHELRGAQRQESIQ